MRQGVEVELEVERVGGGGETKVGGSFERELLNRRLGIDVDGSAGASEVEKRERRECGGEGSASPPTSNLRLAVAPTSSKPMLDDTTKQQVITDNQTLLQNHEPKDVLRWFQHLATIPHGSGEEQDLSNSLKGWAESKGLEVKQDEVVRVQHQLDRSDLH